MNKEQQSDKIIRSKLKHHASPLPTHLWEGIDAILEEDKKSRRGGFWWWTGGAALLLFLATAWFLTLNNSDLVKQSTDSQTISELEKMSLSPESKSHRVENISSAKDEDETEEPNTLDTQTTNEALPTKATKAIKTVSNTEYKKQANQTSIPTVLIDETNDSQLALSETTVNALPELAETKIDIPEKNEAFIGLQMSPKSLLLEDDALENLDWNSLINKDPKCARFGKWLKLYFYADAYISPDIAFRTLSPKETDYSEYSQIREATESPGVSFSTGLRLSVVSNYGWAARTGIVYSQINEKFDYQSESEQRITITEKYNAAGEIIGHDTLVEHGTRYITTHNHYRMVDIPVILGYEMNFKKITLSLNSGVYLNILSRQKGDFLSPENKLVSFSSEDKDPYPAFKNHLNLSVYGSVGVLYNLTDRWQLMLEPHVRYYVDPLTKTNYMIEQSYFSTGLITGLRYKF